MNKKNKNRGFIATAVLYSLVIIVSLALFIILKNLATTRKIERDTGTNVKGELLYYEIDYNGNGNTAGSMKKEKKPSGKNVELAKCEYSKTGYSFAGWTRRANLACNSNPNAGENSCYGDQATVRNLAPVGTTLTLYAQWKANQYTVTFDPVGGTPKPGNRTVTYDQKYGNLPNVSKTGYTFKGWHTTKNSGGAEIKSTTIVKTTSNHTLYARWDANNYTLLFNANGGVVSPTTKQVTYDSNYGTLPTPSRSGYSFQGWFTAVTGGSEVKANNKYTKTGHQTLYARWKANQYTVKFNANGGTVSTSSKQVTYNSTYGTLPTPSRTGYTFEGWFTAPSGGTRIYETTQYRTAGHQTLYAQWRIKQYTVKFNANGGTVSTSSKQVTYNSTYGTLPTPSRTGYTFEGWFTAPSGGAKIKNTTIVKTTSNHTLYAQWSIKQYKVTFNANGGTVKPTTKQVTYNSTYGTLPTPTKTGYDFQGWYTSASGGSKVTSNSKYTKTSDQILYAHWKGQVKVLYDPVNKINVLKWSEGKGGAGKNGGSLTFGNNYMEVVGKRDNGRGGSYYAETTANVSGFTYIYIIGKGRSYSSDITVGDNVVTTGCNPKATVLYTQNISGKKTVKIRADAYSDFASKKDCNEGHGFVRIYKIIIANKVMTQSQVSAYK